MKPCHEFPGARTSAGYGILARNGQRLLAHRAAWIDAFGPIPKGLNVLHHCDNPPCIEPTHLFVGTQGDNLRDMYAKGRRKQWSLNADQVRAIRASTEPADRLAARYIVGVSTIYNVRARRTWAWVE